MLKVLQSEAQNSQSLKIGEVYLPSTNNYYVKCCICKEQIDFEEFQQHFQALHFQKHSYVESQVAVKEEKADTEEITNDAGTVALHMAEQEQQKDEELIDLPQIKDELIESDAIAIETAQLEISENERNFEDEDNSVNSVFSNANSEADAALVDEDELKETTKTASFTCTQCKRSYQTKDQLARHKYKCKKSKKDKNKETYKCADCEQTFRTSISLKHHQYTHTGISCEICGKTFQNIFYMRKHRARHTSTKTYKCDQCDKEFKEAHHLRLHHKRHANNWSIICEVCGKRCFDSTLLRAHMLRHTGERPAKCDVCGKGFYSNYDLKQHAVKHSNERPFECDICKETFALKKTLGVHKKKHSNKPLIHVCEMCDKAFAEAKGLTAHMRSHDVAKNNVTLLTKQIV